MSLKVAVLIALVWFATDSHQEERNLADSSNEFCFNLLYTIPEEENVFISPAGIYVALGMLYAGASGWTAEIMLKVLKLNHTNIHQSFGNLIRLLNNGSEEYSLEMANALLYDQRYAIRSRFEKVLKDNYGALLKEIDFRGDKSEAIADINNWVSQKTHEKIPEFIKELPNPWVVMTLLNAVYFRGYWTMPFAPEATTDAPFYNDGIHKVSVPTMTLRERVPYGEFQELGLDAVELPYKGDHISMLILLPNSFDKLNEIERSVGVNLNYIASHLSSSLSQMILHLPKFKLEDSRSLNENLIDLGLGNLFTEKANFSEVSSGRLSVSDFMHKSVIEVYENGTEAASATGVFFVPLSFAKVFRVNHPFLFFIRDHRTNLVLFAGRVNRL